MEIFSDFYTFDPTKEIYVKSANAQRVGGHAVVIDGWGTENGVKYWWARNSWGPEWGQGGYFRILRGVNHCGIEENTLVGIPDFIYDRYIDSALTRALFSDLALQSGNRMLIVSSFSPMGGFDGKTGISRRLLSYDKIVKSAKNIPLITDSDDTFIAGQVTSSPNNLWLWVVLCWIAVAVVVVVYFNQR